MVALLTRLQKLAKREEGPTIIEYGILTFFIAALCLGAVQLLGSTIRDVLAAGANGLDSVLGGGTGGGGGGTGGGSGSGGGDTGGDGGGSDHGDGHDHGDGGGDGGGH